MENVGRNDPCPCGSGQKFKKCHGGVQPAPQRDEWKSTISMDQRLLSEVAKFGVSHFAAEGFDPFFLEPDHDHADGEECAHGHESIFADVSFPLSLFSDTRFGEPIAALYLQKKGAFISADERAWLHAQLQAQFSLWQLEGIGEEDRVVLKNRIDDRSITLVDGELFREGKKGELLLARLVSIEDRHVLSSVHPDIVAEDAAEAAVAYVKEMLKNAPDAKDLRSYAGQLALVDAWHGAVYPDDDTGEEEAPKA